MGEVKSALDVHLSSTDRAGSTVQDMMALSKVSLYADQVLHRLRHLLERWSLMRIRGQVLKVAATLTVPARRLPCRLGDAAYKWWPTLLKGLSLLTTQA